MKIHLQSDIHLEFSAIKQHASANVYVCAGDIGLLTKPDTVQKYFENILENYANDVIWVLGNHEFYGSEHLAGIEKAQKLSDKIGIHLLDIQAEKCDVELAGVKFWGSTLWTDFKGNDPIVKFNVQQGLNDYRLISQNGISVDAEYIWGVNQQTRSRINWNADVIVTHHVPILKKHPRFAINSITHGFCNTGLEGKIADSSVKYWLYGHDHTSDSVRINNTVIQSNQRGYQSNQFTETSGFDPDLIIEI